MSVEIVTSGRALTVSLELQLEHESHDPPKRRMNRSQIWRAKYAAATATIRMAKMSCMV